MDSKKIIEQLVKIAVKQQKIINRLAQATPTGSDPAPQHLEPAASQKRPAEAILAELKEPAKSAVPRVEVHGNTVHVWFNPGKASQAAFKAVSNAVVALQNRNELPPGSYSYKAEQ